MFGRVTRPIDFRMILWPRIAVIQPQKPAELVEEVVYCTYVIFSRLRPSGTKWGPKIAWRTFGRKGAIPSSSFSLLRVSAFNQVLRRAKRAIWNTLEREKGFTLDILESGGTQRLAT